MNELVIYSHLVYWSLMLIEQVCIIDKRSLSTVWPVEMGPNWLSGRFGD